MAILGHNGNGKSTMIQNLNELLHFISGRVFSMAETISWRKGIS
ncbi:MAG: ATP-binding cassette domain-containing protein [Lachnospiraceae bacterium]|nr:ATP-binding cassette domain-containing protein [Lachnospiraceae bacterium]